MATDQEKNLIVLTEHVRNLAMKQQKASDKLIGANRALVDPARHVQDTHGMVCVATSSAVESALAARRAAGAQVQKVSFELSTKLNSAADHYDNTDGASAQMLRQQML